MELDAENDLIRARVQKLARLRESGRDPFAIERFDRTQSAIEAVRRFQELEDREDAEPLAARLAGRLTTFRNMGKAAFADLRDESGRIQLYFKLNHLGPERYAELDLLDPGDFLGAEGEVFRTRTGEVTLEVRDYVVLSKSLRPLPLGKTVGEEHHGDVTDVEFRYRRPGSPPHGRGLPARPGVRDAPDRRPGHRHRPAGDDPHEHGIHPGRDPVSADETTVGGCQRARV